MRITSRLVQLAACAAFVAASTPLGAAPTTVKGEVVDVACYTKNHDNKGAAHKGCTEDCAKKGKPLALVTPDGMVYAIVGDYAADSNAKLLPMLSVPVEATGEVTEKDGAKQINVASMKKAS
jgi:predicted lipoprotein with Yx(FWY)xxD motif